MATLLLLSLDPATGSSPTRPPPTLRRWWWRRTRSRAFSRKAVESARRGPGATLPRGVEPAAARSDRAPVHRRPDRAPGSEHRRRVRAPAHGRLARRGRPGVLAGHVLREMLGDAVRPDDVALLAVHLVPLPPELDIRLPGPRDDLASLREELRVWLGRQDVPIAHVEEIILACSEATANAMEHAYGAARPVRIPPRVTAARSWSRSATPPTGGAARSERGAASA